MMRDYTLTMRDLVALHAISAAIERNSHIRWLIDDDTQTIGEGTVRSVNNAAGWPLDGTDDVRDAYLRVTSTLGVEHHVSIRRLMDLVHTGGFAVTRSAD